MKCTVILMVCTLASCLASSGCRSQANVVLTEADQTAIRQALDAQLKAANARDFAGWAAVYVEDGILLPPNEPSIQGRTAIQTALTALPPTSDFRAQLLELDGRGDLAYARGTYSVMITPPGAAAPVQDRGKYLQIYRKQADGSWKLMRDMFNSDIPLPGPGPTAASKK